MRQLLLVAALVATTMTPSPAQAGGLGVAVVERVAAPGEDFVVAITVQNRAAVDKRFTLRMRLRGHNRADRAARRYRFSFDPVRVTVRAGEDRDLRLLLPVPEDAAGAVRIEVRRGGDRRLVDAWVSAPDPVPGASAGDRVPYQPLVRVGAVREFDGIQTQHERVIRDRESWEALLDEVRLQTPDAWGRETDYRDHGDYVRPVDVDFTKETVLAIFAGGRPHVDFIRVLRVRAAADGAVTCAYRIVKYRPRHVLYTADHSWAPYVFVTIPKTDAEVRFRRSDARRDPRSRRPR